MHQQIDDDVKQKPTQRDLLLAEKEAHIKTYRNQVIWACRVWEYKRRFKAEEDWEADGLNQYMEILREDSRRALRDVANHIKWLRNRISEINDELMNLAGE